MEMWDTYLLLDVVFWSPTRSKHMNVKKDAHLKEAYSKKSRMFCSVINLAFFLTVYVLGYCWTKNINLPLVKKRRCKERTDSTLRCLSVLLVHYYCYKLLNTSTVSPHDYDICLEANFQMHKSCWAGWVLLHVHRNRRLIRDGSPGRSPPLSHSS